MSERFDATREAKDFLRFSVGLAFYLAVLGVRGAGESLGLINPGRTTSSHVPR